MVVLFNSDHVTQIVITSVPYHTTQVCGCMAQAGPEFVYGYFTEDKRKMISSFKVVKLGNVSPGNVTGYIYTLVVAVLKIMLTHKE